MRKIGIHIVAIQWRLSLHWRSPRARQIAPVMVVVFVVVVMAMAAVADFTAAAVAVGFTPAADFTGVADFTSVALAVGFTPVALMAVVRLTSAAEISRWSRAAGFARLSACVRSSFQQATRRRSMPIGTLRQMRIVTQGGTRASRPLPCAKRSIPARSRAPSARRVRCIARIHARALRHARRQRAGTITDAATGAGGDTATADMAGSARCSGLLPTTTCTTMHCGATIMTTRSGAMATVTSMPASFRPTAMTTSPAICHRPLPARRHRMPHRTR